MNAKKEYIAGKQLVRVDIQTFIRPTGVFGWILFDGLILHQRDDGFFIDRETGYEQQPTDSLVMANLVKRLLYSDFLPGECQVMSAGAWDDIGFNILIPEPKANQTCLDEILTIVGRTLLESNLAIKFI